MKKQFKKGAASFYIVAFSTLILIIIAMSFAALMISQITRTSNNDLSQSAYDSALAGVEDGKLAIANYQNCKANREKSNCEAIIQAVREQDSCDEVNFILGRTDANKPVQIIETNTQDADNNMVQYYTCAKITSSLSDYKGTLSSTNPIRVVRVKFDKVPADDIKRVKISWTRISETTNSNDLSYPVSGDSVVFAPNKITTPPVISLAMIQTAEEFTYEDFESSQGDRTDRGMIYLAPTDKEMQGSHPSNKTNNFAEWSKTEKTNKIGKEAFWKSNDKTVVNLPYMVSCPDSAGTSYLCSAMIDIPDQIGERRSNNTFAFIVALPYGGPTTDFALEFFCEEGRACYEKKLADGTTESTNQVNLDEVQIEIDSTGKANDLFRRVQARVEGTNNYALSIMGPLELLGTDDNSNGGNNYRNTSSELLKKNFAVTCEYNFSPSC